MNKLKVITIASVLLLSTNANATSPGEVKDELIKQKDMLVSHISTQVDKTKKYQSKSWEEGKAQLKQNWITIKSWFNGDNELWTSN